MMGTHVLQLIGASPFGGATRVILSVSRGLLRAGYRVSVLASDAKTLRSFAEIGADPIACRQFVRPIRPVEDLRAVLETVSVCRSRGVTVLHTHTSKGGAIGRMAGRLLGRQVIHTVHGYPFHEFSTRLDRVLFRAVEGACGRLATHTIFVNGEDRDDAVRHRWVAPAKCSVIPNGIAVPALPSAVADHGGRPIIATVGRLSAAKGYPVLLEAFAALLCTYPGARLWFVGDGESRAALEEQAGRLGLLDNVRFLGFQDDPYDWLSQCHVAVSSSLWEGMPVAVLEMMAAHRPTVATACRGTREVLTHGVEALLVRPGEAPALAAALIEMLGDGERARAMAARARAKVEARYTEDRMVASYVALFRQLAPIGVHEHVRTA